MRCTLEITFLTLKLVERLPYLFSDSYQCLVVILWFVKPVEIMFLPSESII